VWLDFDWLNEGAFVYYSFCSELFVWRNLFKCARVKKKHRGRVKKREKGHSGVEGQQ